MSRRKQVLGLALLIAAATSVPALAFGQQQPQPYPQCTKTVSTSESDLAHQKYIAGKQDYDEGNYDSAIRRFRDAYNLDCTKHELLIIISAAYEKRGDLAGKKEALNALETYVARAPSAPDVGTYQAKIENLKKQIAAAPAPTPTPTATSTPPPSGEVQEHTVGPWIVVGVGAAAVITGIVIIATTPELPAQCDADKKTCTPLPGESPDQFKSRQEQAGNSKDQPVVGGIIAGAGGVLVLGGLVWHFLEPTGPKESAAIGKKSVGALPPKPTTKVAPAVAPGFAGLAVGGTF